FLTYTVHSGRMSPCCQSEIQRLETSQSAAESVTRSLSPANVERKAGEGLQHPFYGDWRTGMKPLYDVKMAAEALAISPWTVRAYIRDGKLRPVRIGRLVRLEVAELDRFVDEHSNKSEHASFADKGIHKAE